MRAVRPCGIGLGMAALTATSSRTPAAGGEPHDPVAPVGSAVFDTAMHWYEGPAFLFWFGLGMGLAVVSAWLKSGVNES